MYSLGYLTRKELGTQQGGDEKSAVVLQSCYRGYKARRRRKEGESADVISGSVRGYQHRKKLVIPIKQVKHVKQCQSKNPAAAQKSSRSAHL